MESLDDSEELRPMPMLDAEVRLTRFLQSQHTHLHSTSASSPLHQYIHCRLHFGHEKIMDTVVTKMLRRTPIFVPKSTKKSTKKSALELTSQIFPVPKSSEATLEGLEWQSMANRGPPQLLGRTVWEFMQQVTQPWLRQGRPWLGQMWLRAHKRKRVILLLTHCYHDGCLAEELREYDNMWEFHESWSGLDGAQQRFLSRTPLSLIHHLLVCQGKAILSERSANPFHRNLTGLTSLDYLLQASPPHPRSPALARSL
ncbi:uncharacterized protein BDR25DRAFT_361448 [Lindgomyces ingoldianus]|uniref:Uncharacterized protein n=1 Tax=Lindgomyces ingoldianus TaxID=673940 RepID=A0ACB6QC45_9PLEO|nr:uncharacterized protein BDR25DRAFT_361448 [Lindgomyces ingoldianus]KAF2464609.1 hypothetical protein BDR25DRAFT_361448 [Lindgomyces ingoldianus]